MPTFGGQRSIFDVLPQEPATVFSEALSLITLKLSEQAKLAANELRRTFCLYDPCDEILMWILRVELRSSADILLAEWSSQSCKKSMTVLKPFIPLPLF